jgi:Single-strand binding protein family
MSAFSLLRSSMRTATTSPCVHSIRARAFSSSPRSALARIIITGRLGAEPELQATSTGQEVVQYTVGTSYGPKNNRQTSWFRISSFQQEGPSREHLLGLPKGSVLCLPFHLLPPHRKKNDVKSSIDLLASSIPGSLDLPNSCGVIVKIRARGRTSQTA